MYYRILILAFALLLLAGCGRNSEDAYQDNYGERLQDEVRLALQNGRYDAAISLINFLGDFPHASQMRDQAYAGIMRRDVRNNVLGEFNVGNYENVLAILEDNPEFYDEDNFGETARARIIERDAMADYEEEAAIEILSAGVTDMFRVATLEIHTRNMTTLEFTPRGFLNPGTITAILEFDSTVQFGVANPEAISMRRDIDTLFVRRDSIQISVMNSTVSNFDKIQYFTSNPVLGLMRR